MENCEIKYKIYKEEDFIYLKNNNNLSNSLIDIYFDLKKNVYFPDVLYITEIFIDKNLRNKGYGSSILQKLTNENEDKLIVVCSGLLEKEFKEEPSKEQFENILKKLKNFYTKNNFVNVNDFYGQNIYSETFIYKNEQFNIYIKKFIELKK